MATRIKISFLILIFAAATAGCTHYLKITDPASGTNYYTKNLNHHDGGRIVFKDARTGAKVSLQSYEKIKITKNEFKQAKQGKLETAPPAAKPEAPAPAADAKTDTTGTSASGQQ